jgi:hypothetical protein
MQNVIFADFNNLGPRNTTDESDILHLRAAESHVYSGDKMLYSCTASGSGVVNPIIWGFRFDDDGTFNYTMFDFGELHLHFHFVVQDA